MPTHEEIKRLAFCIWEKDKGKSSTQCWSEAEHQLSNMETLTSNTFERMIPIKNPWGLTDL